MSLDVSAPARAPFLQTPESLIDDTELSANAFRFLCAMVKLAPRNARNSDAVARSLKMGKDRTNRARQALRDSGHWHARKQQRPGTREIGDQRMASLVPLTTPDEIAAGWAAAEEAARLGKDTAESRRLGVRILNSVVWYAAADPAAGSGGPPATRRRPPKGDKTRITHTPHPAPEPPAEPAPRAPKTLPPELPALTGPLATYADQAEQVLLTLRRHDPPLPLTVPDAHELAQLAGHYLLRGETRDSLRAVLTQGLPSDGIRSPRGFLHNRLVRYLPPEKAAASSDSWPPPPPSAVTPPHAPDGPVARLRAGMSVREVLKAARAEG